MTDENQTEKRQLWRSITRAVDTETREATSIRGASGLQHPVQAIGVDEKAKRVVVISAEANARVAALMQVDVQQTMPDYNLIVARPVIIDLGVIARRLFQKMPPRIPMQLIEDYNAHNKTLTEEQRQARMVEIFNEVAEPVVRGWKNAKLPTATQVLDLAGQFTQLDWDAIGASIKEGTTEQQIDLTSLAAIDPMSIDRAHGVCPIPLFEFSEADWDAALNESRVDELRERLRGLDVLQFFYPSPDQIALGMVGRGGKQEEQVIEAIAMAPMVGHPLSQPEIVPSISNFKETIDALKASGHIVSGEYSLELTEAGKAVRASVSIRPKESFISKLGNIISLKVDVTLRDLFK